MRAHKERLAAEAKRPPDRGPPFTQPLDLSTEACFMGAGMGRRAERQAPGATAIATCPFCREEKSTIRWDLPRQSRDTVARGLAGDQHPRGSSVAGSGNVVRNLCQRHGQVRPDGTTQTPYLGTARGRCSKCGNDVFAEVSHQRGTAVITEWRKNPTIKCNCEASKWPGPPAQARPCRCPGPSPTDGLHFKHAGYNHPTALGKPGSAHAQRMVARGKGLSSRIEYELRDAVASLEAWYHDGVARMAAVEQAFAPARAALEP